MDFKYLDDTSLNPQLSAIQGGTSLLNRLVYFNDIDYPVRCKTSWEGSEISVLFWKNFEIKSIWNAIIKMYIEIIWTGGIFQYIFVSSRSS